MGGVLRIGCDRSCRAGFGTFDEGAAFEAGPGADEGDEVGRVHGPPPGLGGLDELETIVRFAPGCADFGRESRTFAVL